MTFRETAERGRVHMAWVARDQVLLDMFNQAQESNLRHLDLRALGKERFRVFARTVHDDAFADAQVADATNPFDEYIAFSAMRMSADSIDGMKTVVRGELPDDIYAGVQQLCAAGDEAAERRGFNEAIGFYRRALALLPSPPTDWEAATWIYAAIGDACFFEKDLTSALSAFEQALRSPDGIGNPFLHLRRGQILFDMGQETAAADELARAYMSEGEEIFQAEDPKYLAHVKSVLRPPGA